MRNNGKVFYGNCDTFLYLGGNEESTFEYVSKLLGKETLDIDSHSRSMGRNGSYSTSFQRIARELLTLDEVRLVDNQYAILFIRGERPVIDKKFDIMKHKNAKISGVGKGEPYEEDYLKYAEATLKFNTEDLKQIDFKEFKEIRELSSDYEILSEEEIEQYLEERKESENKKGNEENEKEE